VAKKLIAGSPLMMMDRFSDYINLPRRMAVDAIRANMGNLVSVVFRASWFATTLRTKWNK
jgi:hypothetical protein